MLNKAFWVRFFIIFLFLFYMLLNLIFSIVRDNEKKDLLEKFWKLKANSFITQQYTSSDSAYTRILTDSEVVSVLKLIQEGEEVDLNHPTGRPISYTIDIANLDFTLRCVLRTSFDDHVDFVRVDMYATQGDEQKPIFLKFYDAGSFMTFYNNLNKH